MGRRKIIKSDKKVCIQCKKEKNRDLHFYNSDNKMFDGKVPMCKECIKKLVDINDVESLKYVLQTIDKPFIDYIWTNALRTSDPVGDFMRQINSLSQYKGLGFKDSVIGGQAKEKNQQVGYNFSGGILNKNGVENEDEIVVPEELKKKWGRKFPPEEILEFEDKYEILSNNYQIKTELHREFLKKACIASVRMDNAIASGDSKAAQQYATMFKEMTSAGKLQPNQMSKADLSEGLDNFSQLVREVEKAVDIIPILPQFKEKPHDKVDFTIWCYVNYLRDLANLPLVEYRDVYAFYAARKKEWEERLKKLQSDEIEIDEATEDGDDNGEDISE